METATQLLHRLTSDQPGKEWTEANPDPRVVQGLEVNDLSRFPWFYKRYPDGLPRVDLPRDLPSTSVNAVDVLAGTAEIPPGELDLPQLSRLLHLSAGVVRTMERPYAKWLFRAAGSAGGRFPMEVYVALPGEVPGVPAGVYWYHPQDHALLRIGPPPRGASPALVVTGVPWRTGWRYRERGYRHIYWDSGSMLAQTLPVAESAGIPARLYTRFPDLAVAELVGVDRVHEWPLAVVSLGDHEPALEATGAAARGEVDAAPVEFPLVTNAQRAGDVDALGTAWEPGSAVAGSGDGSSLLMDELALARGSQRIMDESKSVPESLFRRSMAVALRGISIPHWAVIHAVDGVRPGLYRWPSMDEPLRAGDLRDELFVACMEQDLGHDAAFVAIAATDLSKLDDRQYREAQLAAGIVEGRLHLMAYALGASASGMTFYDTLMPSLLGEPLAGLIFTCVGVPAYRSRAGGPPGAPVEVKRMVG